MLKFKIEFSDIFEDCESEDQAIGILLKYLTQCILNEDVTAFKIEEVK